jgi:hypothetical protein
MKDEESGKVDEILATKWLGRKRGAIPKPEVPLNLRGFFPRAALRGKYFDLYRYCNIFN